MSKLKFLFLLAAAIVIFTNPALAWDDTGHKLTTYIAWQQMSPQARQQAIKILQAAPEDSHLSVFFMQDSRSLPARQREFFMIASTWADIVRDRNFKNRYAKYHKSNWHYSDTFWRGENGRAEILKNPNEEGGKAVEKLFEFEKVLRAASATDSEKAIALGWILHLGGDIHQPLHTSARISELEPKGDQGGNTFELTPKDTPRENRVNLHWFWDSIIGRNIPRVNDAGDSEYLPAIAAQITRKHPFSKMRNRLKLGKYDDWQQESFRIATAELFPSSLKRYQMPSESYKRRAFQISQEQIALAGYRMGEMLNQIFGNQSAQENEDRTRKEIERTGSTIEMVQMIHGFGSKSVRRWR